MSSDGISEGGVDLFGLPLLPARGKGRPAHVWTDENSNVVNLLLACGRKPIEIAKVLRVSKPTLYKHYFNELANAGHAPLMMRARQLARLNKLAESGNVTAEKALAGMIQAEQLKVLGDRIADHGRPAARRRELREPAIGKKEAAALAARDAGAGTEWGDDLQPPLLN